MTTLDQDRRLLKSFIRDLVRIHLPTSADKLRLLEQQYPGSQELPEDELEKRGVPDGWIFSIDDEWCVIIESKVLIPLHPRQIARHLRTAKQRGFKHVTAVAITPRQELIPPANTVVLEWRIVYQWLHQFRKSSSWAGHLTTFMEITEAKLIEAQQLKEGTLTKFAGFSFDSEHPFSWLEGKRVLMLAHSELRARRDLQKQLGMNPNVIGRDRITGRQADAVWNFLSLSRSDNSKDFTKYPHLTLGITTRAVEAMITIPNAIGGNVKHKLKNLGDDGFRKLIATIVTNMKPLVKEAPGMTPWFRGVQRRYPSQSAAPYVDAEINFDLRTALPNSGPFKEQPVWLAAAYNSFISKRGSNYQMQIGAIFRYNQCPQLRRPETINTIAKSWIACKPIAELLRD